MKQAEWNRITDGETREEYIAKRNAEIRGDISAEMAAKQRERDEQERPIIERIKALTDAHEGKLDGAALEKMAFDYTVENPAVRADFVYNGLYGGAKPESFMLWQELTAFAVKNGMKREPAQAYIRLGVEAGIEERQRRHDNDPVTIANKALGLRLRYGMTENAAATAVYTAIREGVISPGQIRLDEQIAEINPDDPYKMRAAIEKAVKLAEQDKTAKAPTAAGMLAGLATQERTESRFIDVATFEAAINAAMRKAESKIEFAQFVRDKAVEQEIANIKANPTFEQLKKSALKVARRGNDICVDVLDRLIEAMDG